MPKNNNNIPLLPEDYDGIREAENMAKKYEVDNIQAIDGNLLECMKCGDMVIKKTIESKKELYHTYIVSHKQATGICMTYSDCGYCETVSYDKIDGVWTYNSTDVWQAE